MGAAVPQRQFFHHMRLVFSDNLCKVWRKKRIGIPRKNKKASRCRIKQTKTYSHCYFYAVSIRCVCVCIYLIPRVDCKTEVFLVVLIHQIGYYSFHEKMYYYIIKITVHLSPHVDWSVWTGKNGQAPPSAFVRVALFSTNPRWQP